MSDEKPEIQLFIKSSTIDREQKGSCPLCQQWFMAACILTEQGILSFHVTIVDAESPPKEFKDLSQSKIFPVVKGIRGLNKRGQDIGDKLADDHERLEEFFESFGCPDLKRDGAVQKHFDDLYKHFNAFLQNGTDQARQRLIHHLEKLNGFLEGEDQLYVIKDSITYGDCYLMPRLHHIKVAGREFADFEIPENLFYIWRYLFEAYKTDAFQKTCPTDQDIIKHYEKKAKVFKPKKGVPSLQKSTYSFDVPESVLVALENQPARSPRDGSAMYDDFTNANAQRNSDAHTYDHSYENENADDAVYADPDEILSAGQEAEAAPSGTPDRSASPEPMQTGSPIRSASPNEADQTMTGYVDEATYENADEFSPTSAPPQEADTTPAEADTTPAEADTTPTEAYTIPTEEDTTPTGEAQYTALDGNDMPAPDYDSPPVPDYNSTPVQDYDTSTPVPDYDNTPTPDYDSTPAPDYAATDGNATPSEYTQLATPEYTQLNTSSTAGDESATYTNPQDDGGALDTYAESANDDAALATYDDTTPMSDGKAANTGEADTSRMTPDHDDSMTYENVDTSIPEPSSNAKSLDLSTSAKIEDSSSEQTAEVRVNGGTNVTNGHE